MTSPNDRFFFAATGMDPDSVTRAVKRALSGADGGELYLQRSMGRSLTFSDGRLESNKSGLSQGFGLRYIVGDAAGYAHSSDLSEAALRSAASAVKGIRQHKEKIGVIALPGTTQPLRLYTNDNPLDDMPEDQRVKLLRDIDQKLRTADPRVKQVTASLATGLDVVTIIQRDGRRLDDVRPMSTLRIEVVMEENGRKERGTGALSGRATLTNLFSANSWEKAAEKALAQAKTNLLAVPAPSGEMPVVIGNGWGGVLLHEAVGHGLEGDAARKKTTVYKTEFLGQQVASKGVTIGDRGNIPFSRGSLAFDDEGVPTQDNILIEDGVLKGYMQDTINARMMGVAPTGNGRRQSFVHVPIPRMTATYMNAGPHTHDEIIASVKRGVYVTDFAGGEVHPATGEFVFAATEAYEIEDGKIGRPVKGATLIGSCLEAMANVEMIGNNLEMAQSGMCGKGGQTVPVGIGQPTIKIGKIKVGGTAPS